MTDLASCVLGTVITVRLPSYSLGKGWFWVAVAYARQSGDDVS